MHLFGRLLGDSYPACSKKIHEGWAYLFPKWYVRYYYKMVTNKKLDLKNPKDYNEKIQWMKIYSDTSRWTDLADKCKVRKYVNQCGLSHILVKLYGVWDSAEEIDFSKLPDRFVLKTNHGFSRIILVEDKSKLDIDLTVKQLNKWMKEKYGLCTFEPHYWNIKRRIIAEELLQDDHNASISSSLIDYKFYCFYGKVHSLLVLYDRRNIIVGADCKKDGPKVRARIYDLDWNPRPGVTIGPFEDECPAEIPKPNRFDEMLEVCKILSLPFPHVRVDLYEVNNKVYFGELTFTPGAGLRYLTPEYFLEMGDQIDLSSVKRRTKRAIV